MGAEERKGMANASSRRARSDYSHFSKRSAQIDNDFKEVMSAIAESVHDVRAEVEDNTYPVPEAGIKPILKELERALSSAQDGSVAAAAPSNGAAPANAIGHSGFENFVQWVESTNPTSAEVQSLADDLRWLGDKVGSFFG